MLFRLSNRCLVKVSGSDSETFLQSQFSNDIIKISEGNVQINAYCQHQGKIIAIIWVIKKKGNYFLSLPNDLKNLVLSKLNMYKLMSQVVVEDFSTKIKQYGLIGESRPNSFKVTNNLSLLFSIEKLESCDDISMWEFACIQDKLPEVYSINSESFIPQALNLDINSLGVSFTKGCYPGQEVVARMHYLGKPKRRLYKFKSEFKAAVGDTLNSDNSISLKSSGQIIRVSRIDNCYYFLATFEVGLIENKIFLSGYKDKRVEIIYE